MVPRSGCDPRGRHLIAVHRSPHGPADRPTVEGMPRTPAGPRTHSARNAAATVAAVALVAAVSTTASASTPARGGVHGIRHDGIRRARPHPARRDVQRVTQPHRGGRARQRPVDSGQRAGQGRCGGHPARRPGPAAHQRVRLRRGRPRGAALPRQLPRTPPERRRPGRLPLLLRRPGEHGGAERPRPRQQRLGRWGQRRVRVRVLPGAVRDGGLLQAPHRHRGGAHLPAPALEGHAGRAAARRPQHAGPG